MHRRCWSLIGGHYRRLSTSALLRQEHVRLSGVANTKFWDLVKRYEDFIGVTEVREAQDKVLQAEMAFVNSQSRRREQQQALSDVNQQIRDVHGDLDKTHRSEDRYLELLTKEHNLIKQQKASDISFRQLEAQERDQFSVLSQRLRESHEKERARTERTKYWSLIGSLIGAFLGVLGTTVNNRLKMKELRSIVQESADPGRLQSALATLTGVIHTQQNQVRSFLNELKSIIQNGQPGSLQLLTLGALPGSNTDRGHGDSSTISNEEILRQFDSLAAALQSQDDKLSDEMQNLKGLIAADHASSSSKPQIIYVGPQLEDMLDQTEQNLEWKMKINTLVAVAAVYGALAIILPIVASALGGAGGG